jgi:hypothetical protein
MGALRQISPTPSLPIPVPPATLIVMIRLFSYAAERAPVPPEKPPSKKDASRRRTRPIQENELLNLTQLFQKLLGGSTLPTIPNLKK